jgi:hypothetical protein
LLLPHWLILVGVLTLMFGFVGLAFHRNSIMTRTENNPARNPEQRLNELTSQLLPVRHDPSQMRKRVEGKLGQEDFPTRIAEVGGANIGRDIAKLARPQSRWRPWHGLAWVKTISRL